MARKQNKNGGRKSSPPIFQPKYEDNLPSIPERLSRAEGDIENLKDIPAEVHDLSSSVSKLQGGLTVFKWLGGILVPIIIAALGFIIKYGIVMYSDIAVLKSESPLALSKKAESIIKNSDSPDALAEANSLIVRASKSTSGFDPPALARIATSLAAQPTPAIETSPQYWRTVSTVVNLTSEYTGRPTLTNSCFSRTLLADLTPHAIDDNGNIVPGIQGSKPVSVAEIRMENCSLQIDNLDQFWNSPDAKILKEREAANPNLKTRILVLKNVEVHYAGGQLLPFTKIECINCSFVMDVPATPNPSGQSLMKQLLVANLEEPKLTLSITQEG